MLESLFNKVTGLQACNSIKKTPTLVLSYEYCKNFKNTILTEHLRWLLHSFMKTQWADPAKSNCKNIQNVLLIYKYSAATITSILQTSVNWSFLFSITLKQTILPPSSKHTSRYWKQLEKITYFHVVSTWKKLYDRHTQKVNRTIGCFTNYSFVNFLFKTLQIKQELTPNELCLS